MSCSNGSCSCGSNCSCGASCNCGSESKRNPSLSYTETASTTVIIAGVAPVKIHFEEMGEMSREGGQGCKCGGNCKCDPCNC